MRTTRLATTRSAIVRLCLAAGLAGISVLALASIAQAKAIAVTTTADPAGSGSCPGDPCSLRQAVDSAESGDTIELAGSAGAPAKYALTQGTQIVVGQQLTIQGNGIDATTIDGSANRAGSGPMNRILKVIGGTLSITGVNFTGGSDENDEKTSGCSPCTTLSLNGGGDIFNQATVKLEGDAFTAGGNNSLGGAIANNGSLEMKDVIFEHVGAAFGGGLFSRGGAVTAEDVTFEEDGGFGFGGGAVFLYAGGSATFINTTVVGSGTASALGGGIENAGANLTLRNDTLSGNLRGSLQTEVGATTTVQNTIIASGFDDGGDFACTAPGKSTSDGGTTTAAITVDLGSNIDQDKACGLNAAGDISGVDPQLAPIAANGGFTRTQALAAASPAIDAGDDGACPATDQRGVTRPLGARCDIGAFEAPARVAPPLAPPPTQAQAPVLPPSNTFSFHRLKLNRKAGTTKLAIDGVRAGSPEPFRQRDQDRHRNGSRRRGQQPPGDPHRQSEGNAEKNRQAEGQRHGHLHPDRRPRQHPDQGDLAATRRGLTPPAGFEPATIGLEGRRSVH